MQDQQFNDYILSLVERVLQTPQYAALSGPDREQKAIQIEDHFNQLIIEVLIEHLNEDQLSQLEALDISSPEMEEKIAYFAAGIPGMAIILQERLNEEVLRLTTPQN